MLKIIGFKSYQNQDGSEFCTLRLSGGVNPVRSGSTGKIYLTNRKATIATTFDSDTCKLLVGTELTGTIEKIEVEPYTYTLSNGETITLSHRYEYVNEEITFLESNTAKIELVS